MHILEEERTLHRRFEARRTNEVDTGRKTFCGATRIKWVWCKKQKTTCAIAMCLIVMRYFIYMRHFSGVGLEKKKVSRTALVYLLAISPLSCAGSPSFVGIGTARAAGTRAGCG